MTTNFVIEREKGWFVNCDFSEADGENIDQKPMAVSFPRQIVDVDIGTVFLIDKV